MNVDAKTANYGDFTTVADECPNVVVNYRAVRFSIIRCTPVQLKLVYELALDLEYLHKLSGQCYPCCTSDFFDSFFNGKKMSYLMMDTEEQVLR